MKVDEVDLKYRKIPDIPDIPDTTPSSTVEFFDDGKFVAKLFFVTNNNFVTIDVFSQNRYELLNI